MAGLKAIMLNCTLKYSPELSNTEALMRKVMEWWHRMDVETEVVRVTDYHVRFGVTSDEGDGDEWPQILEKIKAADIICIGTPIWFGVRGSVAQLVIERLDGTYAERNEVGQYPLYNKVGCVVVTGNEDGAHAAAETTLFNLSHLGCTIPPNADTYWVGDAGPGPSYIEAGGENHASRSARPVGWPTTRSTSHACCRPRRSLRRATRSTRRRTIDPTSAEVAASQRAAGIPGSTSGPLYSVRPRPVRSARPISSRKDVANTAANSLRSSSSCSTALAGT
jgi:multimeric flavodoxin WrbA